MLYLHIMLLVLGSFVQSLANLPGAFEVVGSTGVPAMHAALMPSGQVMFLDKIESYTELKLPNGQLAYSSLYNPSTRKLRALSVATNAFCCGGTFLADGRLVTLGGNDGLLWLDSTVQNGFDGIRYLSADTSDEGWSEPGNKMASKRWYASAQTMPDGSVFVAAGSLTGLDQTNFSNNNPTYEILDQDGVSQGQNVAMDILTKNQPYWMYPFLHLMTDGTLFVFASRSSQIFNVGANKIERRMPDLPGMQRTYPNTGGSVMLPLTKQNNFEPEIMICGGGQFQALDSPCDATCGRIEPMSAEPKWDMTTMPEPRGMVEGVLLLDGTVLWINGAQRGAQGFGIADTPALEALIYDPKLGSWAVAGKSQIARLYHSVALLLLDGTVLVASSNPNEMPILMDQVEPSNQYKAFPTEFRIEIYTPSYLMGHNAAKRPRNVQLSTLVLKPGGNLTVHFEFPGGVESADVVLYSGGFVTHAVHMGQVMMYLPHQGWELEGVRFRITADVPKIKGIAPGPYVVYVVVNGVPGIGQFVRVEM